MKLIKIVIITLVLFFGVALSDSYSKPLNNGENENTARPRHRVIIVRHRHIIKRPVIIIKKRCHRRHYRPVIIIR